MPRDKSQYSFLIALSRQLETALAEGEEASPDVQLACARLADSMGLLIASGLAEDGEDTDSDDDGFEDESSDGPGHRLGSLSASEQEVLAELQRRAGVVATAGQRRALGAGTAYEQLPEPAPSAPVRVKKGGKRRGKK